MSGTTRASSGGRNWSSIPMQRITAASDQGKTPGLGLDPECEVPTSTIRLRRRTLLRSSTLTVAEVWATRIFTYSTISTRRKGRLKKSSGGQLGWERLEGKQACRIRAAVQGGYSDPEESWGETHNRMTDAMNRLVEALAPHIKTLKIEDAVEPIGEESCANNA